MELKRSLLSILGLCVIQVLAQLPVRIVSFNIRYDNTDLSFGDAEQGWLGMTCVSDPTLCRAPGVIKLLCKLSWKTIIVLSIARRTTSAKQPVYIDNAATEASDSGSETIIGLQEVLDNQLSNILESMGSPWTHVGVGRDDGGTGGEYNPILYRTDIFNLVHSETKWLSETPDTAGSKSWGSGSNRIVTIAVLDHKATGRRLLAANTHLDNANAEARVNQIGVAVDIIQAVDAAYGGPGLPVTLTGDFNAGQTDTAYTGLVAEKYVADLYGLATASQKTSDMATYTGFSNEYSSRIDYIWVGPETNALSSYTVNGYKVVDNLVDGVMCSDHRPVVGDLTLG